MGKKSSKIAHNKSYFFLTNLIAANPCYARKAQHQKKNVTPIFLDCVYFILISCKYTMKHDQVIKQVKQKTQRSKKSKPQTITMK